MRKTKVFNSLNYQRKSYDVTITTISEGLPHVESAYQNEMKEPAWKCRYVIAIIGFFVYVLMNIGRTNMSVSIVAMVNNSAISREAKGNADSCPTYISNITDETLRDALKEGEFIWSPRIQGYILGSYFIGYILVQIPTGELVERFGCKWFLFSSTLIPSVCSLLVPPVSWFSAYALIVLQTIRGMSQGLIQVSMATLAANWFPKMERGLLNGVMQSGTALGCSVGSVMSGILCESAGKWPSSFYVTGVMGMVLTITVLFCVTESPSVHPNISKSELNFILKNQENVLTRRRPSTPWRKILTSVPVYAAIYGTFGQSWAFSQFLIVHSTFLGTMLHYPISQNGFFTAVPFLLQFGFSQFAAWVSFYMQNKHIAGVDFLRKFWNFMSNLGYSACLLGIYFAGCNRMLSVVFAVLSTGFTGFGFAGSFIVPNDMTSTFAGIILALSCSFGILASSSLPVVVGYLTDEKQTMEQWRKFFLISIGVSMSSAIVFAIFGSANVQPWNYVEEPSKKVEKDIEKKKVDKENHENKTTSRF